MADPNSSNSAEQLNSPPVSLLELAEDAPENPHAALRGFFAAQIHLYSRASAGTKVETPKGDGRRCSAEHFCAVQPHS